MNTKSHSNGRLRTTITCLALGLANMICQANLLSNSHDITSLSPWGPYSKRYAGISHITDQKHGIRFDFSVMPGFYRNRQLVPHVLFESGYYPWRISPDMRHITYRHELEWKDRVFTDVTYHILNDSMTIVDIHCVNNTPITQNLVLNQIAYIDYPDNYPQIKCTGNSGLKWHNAIDYISNEPPIKSPQYHLVYDGWMRNESRSSQSIDGSVIGRGFGREANHRISYRIDIPRDLTKGVIALRYKVARGKSSTIRLNGLINDTITLHGTGGFAFSHIPYKTNMCNSGQLDIITTGGQEIELDGFYIGSSEQVSKLDITYASIPFIPAIDSGVGNQDVILKYHDTDNYYGMAWNYPNSKIREVYNSELESFFRRRVHDHVSRRLTGDKKWHYTNAFLRPVVLQPNSYTNIYFLLCNGNKKSVAEAITKFHNNPEYYTCDITSYNCNDLSILPDGDKYKFGQQLLQAALLSNVVFPVYTQRQFIRHFTPGKNWNSLYTWDSGFIAMGLLDIDPVKSFECIRAYTTSPGSESAFIHHGTPLPIQIFAYSELINSGYDPTAVCFLYPRLKQFFEFMTDANAFTHNNKSGLLQSWDYFYNSGGWDDYPPQKAVHNMPDRRKNITPVVTTSYYLRAAKIMRMAAIKLGQKNDVKSYDRFIRNLTSSLQQYAWDETSGYYAYVVHDSLGNATDILRYNDGTNYNMGLDGVTPLTAGICSDKQKEVLLNHLFDPNALWTATGISTVDRSAPYYKEDGYWNGAVWFPHQWVIWKTLLDLGLVDEARKIAHTALETWERECKESYFTFEHFIISSGRGAGWHQFSGLSSPILNWFAAYYKPGRVTSGFEIQIVNSSFNDDLSCYSADLSFDDSTIAHNRCLLVCMNPDHQYNVTFNGRHINAKTPYNGMLEILLPATNRPGKLEIKPIK